MSDSEVTGMSIEPSTDSQDAQASMPLDSKLLTILQDDTLALPEDYAEAIAQIHHAYQEAGYTQAQSISYATVMKDGVVNLAANPQNVDLMTGEEWYKRFEQELDELSVTKGLWTDTPLMEAAKRASNLTEGDASLT
jgi:hypothetical protein